MKNDKEIVGTLLGFDDFVNMLLDDVTEYENTPDGQRITKLDQILLNGNTITMVDNCNYLLIYGHLIAISRLSLQLVPGGDIPEAST